MAIADASDVAVSLQRPLTTTESQYVEPLLGRAEALLLVRIPTLLVLAAQSEPLTTVITAIEAEAVARVFRNPTAYRQESEGNYSYSLNYEVASGLLDILDREWERLGLGGRVDTVAPGTDGYLAGRRYGRPDLWFQSGWPAHNDHSNGGEFTL